MNGAFWLIGVTTVIYAGTTVAFAFAMQGKRALALVYLGCTIATVGLMMVSR
jgi:hypothetical protein